VLSGEAKPNNLPPECGQTIDGVKLSFTDLQLLHVLSDLFLAGSDTSATTVLWGLLYLITFPEIQKKVQKEIDDGTERD
jgi:cytochrome P450 family 2 subfamily U polypeptide 1